MHGEALDHDLVAHIAAMSEGSGSSMTVDSSERIEGGWMLTLRGDGNPWEDDGQEVESLPYSDSRHHYVQHGGGSSEDGYHFAYHARHSDLGEYVDATPEYVVEVWVGRTPVPPCAAKTLAQHYHQEVLSGAMDLIWSASRMLGRLPDEVRLGGGSLEDIASINLRLAQL